MLGAKHVSLVLCPLQIPHGGAWNRNRATAVTGRRLAWVVSRPWIYVVFFSYSWQIQELSRKWSTTFSFHSFSNLSFTVVLSFDAVLLKILENPIAVNKYIISYNGWKRTSMLSMLSCRIYLSSLLVYCILYMSFITTLFSGNVCYNEIFVPLQRGNFHSLLLDQDFPPIET